MFIKTVSTTSGINPIKFDETGGVFYWILNTGLSTVYASTKATFTAGDDGVVSLGPKESRRLETNNDTVYILGEGQVEIHNQRDGICSFKQAPTSSGSGGGGTIDAYSKTESDAKYAQKTDIPTSLPANGGNADTVDNKHATDFITGEVAQRRTTIDDCTTSGAYAVSTVYTTDLPTEFGDWGIMDVRVYGLGIVQVIYFTGTKNIIHRSKIMNQIEWTPWERINDGGNADTVGGKVPEKIFYDNGISADLNGATQSGCYATAPDTLNVPFSAWWLVDTTNFNNQFIVQKAHSIGSPTNTVSYIGNYANDVWSDWKEISTTPIKFTTFSSNSDGTGNFNLWTPSENKVPISIQFDNKPFYAVPFLYNNQMWLGSTINEVTRQPVTSTTVSGIVYYIEV